MTGGGVEGEAGRAEELSYHLRVDAPHLVECDRCHRKGWSLDEVDQEDRMTQPNGEPCGGTHRLTEAGKLMARAESLESLLGECRGALARIVGWIERENDPKDLRLRDIADLARKALDTSTLTEGDTG